MTLTIYSQTAILPTDSSEYDILMQAAEMSSHVEGMSCEIGLRRGGGTRMLVDAVLQAGINETRTHVMLDPYGNIEYMATEKKPVRLDYTNDMRHDCMVELFHYYKGKPINLVFFNMEDTEFFRRFPDGVPVYVNGFKKLETHYAMIHLDGPHDSDAVKAEVDFFYPRMSEGAMLVCDDTHMYDHYEKCHEHIVGKGFEEVRRGQRKISYKKVK